jgi:hypothetical protein
MSLALPHQACASKRNPYVIVLAFHARAQNAKASSIIRPRACFTREREGESHGAHTPCGGGAGVGGRCSAEGPPHKEAYLRVKSTGVPATLLAPRGNELHEEHATDLQ